MKRAVALIFAVAIMVSAGLLAYGYKTRGVTSGQITVKGLGSQEFESDLVVWSIRITAQNEDLQAGVDKLANDRKVVEAYFVNQGISKDDLVFSSVEHDEATKPIYNEEGNYVGREFVAHKFLQTVTIESEDLDLIGEVSRKVSDLLNDGIYLKSYRPKYYYSKLDDLKLQLIEEASQNGRQRAEQIAAHSASKLGGLKSAKQGVFQILGKNSEDSFSWGGTFNTSNRYKVASVTVSMEYEVD